ncbi:MAG: toll/interleukin-1 receptor domain-containing protein [Synergistaceae bacterium]|jgi:hypothetical protein|nr:toll/interleukin-1 receptor domain-containing protein [Synergistaceae bacterium]
MIFISHSEENQISANSLVNFLLENIEISPSAIIYTNSNYPDGQDSHVLSAFRASMDAAKVVIAIVSLESLKNSMSMFELGAAWALGKMLNIVFLSGVDMRDMPEPLASCDFVEIDSNDAHIRLMDMARNIAERLTLPEKRGMHVFASLNAAIKALRHKYEPQMHAEEERQDPALPDDDWDFEKLPAAPEGEFCDIVYTFKGKTAIEEIRVRASWDAIFKTIAPHLREPQDEAFIKKLILEFCKERNSDFARGIEYKLFVNPMLNVICYNQIMRHMSSNHYITSSRPPHSIFKNRVESAYWMLTQEGEEHLRGVVGKLRSLKK